MSASDGLVVGRVSFAPRMESYARESAKACYCTGPRPGEPLCPCRMRSVVVRNGRYVIPEQDLGPVPEDRR